MLSSSRYFLNGYPLLRLMLFFTGSGKQYIIQKSTDIRQTVDVNPIRLQDHLQSVDNLRDHVRPKMTRYLSPYSPWIYLTSPAALFSPIIRTFDLISFRLYAVVWSHKPFNHVHMILAQHRRHRIPLGSKIQTTGNNHSRSVTFRVSVTSISEYS